MTDLITTTGGMPVTAPQMGLLTHVQGKLDEAAAHLREAEEALANAKEKKWNTKLLAPIVSRHRKQVQYLEKVKAAVEAGYVIMPSIPGDVFAVRVAEGQIRLPERTVKNPESWQRPGAGLDRIATNSPALGDGDYVAPECRFEFYTRTENTADGKVIKYREETGIDFIREIDFPSIMAKPVLMDATEEAMARRIFDDIAICPSRTGRKKDPIIYGRIHRPYRDPVCFLICWLVKPEEI